MVGPVTEPRVDMSRIRILIADDHPVLLEGLKLVLEQYPDLSVVALADTGPKALREVARGHVDVVLFDLSIPGAGFPCLREMTSHPLVRVIVLTHYEGRAYIEAALRDGARGYLSDRSPPDEIVAAVRAVAAGDIHVHPALDFAPSQGRSAASIPIDALSPRELQVLGLIVHGHTNREIAERLNVSVKTIEGYRARVQEKLGARSRAELVEYAILAGLLPAASAPLDDD